MMIKKNNAIFFILLTASGIYNTSDAEQWTWLFKKKFSLNEIDSNKKRNQLLFSKTNIPNFSQLIFSWNAFKPTKGHFSFYAQVRDAKTQQWHAWHKMIDWGKNIQQSYLNKGPITEYCHVRLEVPKMNLADGLRIKIISSEGSDLSLMRALAVNVSNLTKFNCNIPDLSKQLPTIIIKNIPQQSQMILDHPRAEHMCSPTSCSMLVSYLHKNQIHALDFAHNVYDKGLDSFGSWPFNTAYAYEACNGAILFHVARLNSFNDLYAKLQKSIPVVVSVRGQLDGAPREYKNGHLLLVIGWDQRQKKVICHDPAFENNHDVLKAYDINSFCNAWGRSNHLAYLAEFVE
jgi:hypothetical protein